MATNTPQRGDTSLPKISPPGSVNSRMRFAQRSIPRPRNSLRASTQLRSVSGQNAIRPESRASTNDAAPSRGLSRESSKENLAPPEAEEYEDQRRQIEALKAEVHTLRYTISNTDSEREVERLQHERDLRDAQRRADDDFKKKQAAESDKAGAERAMTGLTDELEALRMGAEQTKKDLEARARAAEDEARQLREQVDEINFAKDEAVRSANRGAAEVQEKSQSDQRIIEELREELQTRSAALEQARATSQSKDDTLRGLEAEVLRLKSQKGDVDAMPVIRRQLADQVQHTRTLEATTQKQEKELQHLRQMRKTVDVVEDEKASLQRKLDAAQAWQNELAEERRQRQRLEDERLSWAAFLRRESVHGDTEFDSPESVARALLQERLNTASLTERLGLLRPELASRDEVIKSLEDEKARLERQLERSKGAAASISADKACLRLERQRALAEKEVAYLREQLKAVDGEDVTFHSESFDSAKATRISELEDLVDKYKSEVKGLHAELSSTDRQSSSTPSLGSKRPYADDEEHIDPQAQEQIGQLARKNRTLQDQLSTLQQSHTLLQTDLDVTKQQLSALNASSQTRILQLRDNPTTNYQSVKQSTITELQAENKDLRRLLYKHDTISYPTVPSSTLSVVQRDLLASQQETASARKTTQRLKEVWASKSSEFKEAIFSTLGWHVTFIPNGKMRVESVYYPSLSEDEHENSIVFDGERGTMKVGGGPRSKFAERIGGNVKYWVREKGCIPGFLASLTLEFWEEKMNQGKAD